MKLKYLGTAAAEGWPALFCDCDNCRRAEAAGGRNIRTRSQSVIDGRLLIDFPADTYLHMLYHGLELRKIRDCIVTHDHSDHLYPADFGMRGKMFANLDGESTFTLYGTEPTGEKVAPIVQRLKDQGSARLEYRKVEPFCGFTAAGYAITPLKADHAKLCQPVFYGISDGERSLLYANDTGYFPDETWEYLESHKPYYNLVSLDCTLELKPCRNNHMDLETNEEVRDRLLQIGCADQKTVFVINHFSHNGGAIYDELVPIAQKMGFMVSYDGMEIEI